MKRIIILLTGIAMGFSSLAQSDTTAPAAQNDTIRIGNMIIIRNKNDRNEKNEENTVIIHHRHHYKPSNISTNWWIVDLGLSQFDDKTDYTAAATEGFVDPAVGKDQFKLRNIKSVNVNLWIFMQRLNMIKNVVNLKYGLGLELNNYRYKEPILYQTNPTHVILDKSTNYKKNKLAADYLTVPIMLNLNFTPNRKRGFGISAGASIGYLYSSRQKTITDASGKHKEHDDFDLRPWKLSYIAELSLGPVRLYGSYATQSMFTKGLDQTPYNLGFRLSNW